MALVHITNHNSKLPLSDYLRRLVYLHFLECVQKVFGPDIVVVCILLN